MPTVPLSITQCFLSGVLVPLRTLRAVTVQESLSEAASAVHFLNDCSAQYSTGTQRALSLRIGAQIQTLLSREGRSRGRGDAV